MPPSFSGGLLCAIASVAATASPKAKTPERTRFMKPPFRHAALFCGLYFDWLDHAACAWQRQAARGSPVTRWLSVAFSAKRNDRPRQAQSSRNSERIKPKDLCRERG